MSKNQRAASKFFRSLLVSSNVLKDDLNSAPSPAAGPHGHFSSLGSLYSTKWNGWTELGIMPHPSAVVTLELTWFLVLNGDVVVK